MGGLGPAIRDRGLGLGLTIEVKRFVRGEEEGARLGLRCVIL